MEMPPTRYATADDGVHVAYQVFGEGSANLVFVWGTMSHLELSWENADAVDMFRRAGSFARVALFDKRGCGMSDRVGAQPTLEERMEDVRAVMDAVGMDRAVIVGESEGVPMSVLFAATYPERVDSLVLYGGIVRPVDDEFPGAVTRDVFEAFVGALVDTWGTGRTLRTFGPSFPRDDHVSDQLGRFERMAMSPGAFQDIMEMISRIDIRPVLPIVSVPTLVLHRRDDGPCSVEQSRYMAQRIPGAKYVELEGNDHLPYLGDRDALFDEIEEFVTGIRAVHEPDRMLGTVLFTDIVDSTATAADLGDRRWREVLDRHDVLVRNELARHRGREVKATGDGFLAMFDGPARAVRCGQAVVVAAADAGVRVRAGVHTGEVEVRGDDVGGIAVHIGARVGSLAGADEVLVSRTVRDLVVGSGIEFEDRGSHVLKGVPDEWQLYAAVG